MAFELVRTTTDVTRGSGRTTVQTGGGHSTTRTSSRASTGEEGTESRTVTEQAHVVTESTTDTPGAISTKGSTEDRSIVVRFSIPFQNREPVLPPGETAPSACP